MRCVCGRSLQPSWREWLFAGVLVLAFVSIFRAERERRDLRNARRFAHALAQRADSLVTDWVKRGCAPRTRALP